MRLHIISGLQIGLGAFGFCVAFGAGAAALQESVSTCETKAGSIEVGRLSTSLIDEASGIAMSPDGQSFFLINDSGDKPRFFRTRLDGSNIEEFRVKESAENGGGNWKPRDPEEIVVGPCPKGLVGDCVVLADIGDNRDNRKSVQLNFVRLDELANPVTIRRKIIFKYPDGPRNAEAFAVVNSRYGVIVSKEQSHKSRESKPAGVYIVDFETGLVARVAEWDVPGWVRDKGLSGLVTSMSVASSGASVGAGSLRILLLTYRDAIELRVDTDILTSPVWPPRPWSVRSRTILKIDPLEQQEAITYDKTATGFYYTTESPLAILGVKYAAIRRVESMTCR